MPNRLAESSSPYLLQHAENPVDWYPWGEKAFEAARSRDVPIFLSIGYATCHWCHVMEHESFEDAEVATLMNQSFVSVKVDREERPDLDHAYMRVCQAIGKGCGWPLTVLLTPEGLPFFVATYLPRHARFGRPGMMELIPRVAELWAAEREKVEASARQIAEMVSSDELAVGTGGGPVAGGDLEIGAAEEALHRAFRALQNRYDPAFGGFGAAPKFPAAHNLIFLIRYGWRFGKPEAIDMAVTTLKAMARSGLMDQVGFGFHRYATDVAWRLPHFEKMLYDQAMLLRALVEAWHLTRNPALQEAAEQSVAYLLRDLVDPEGAFYSGEDADSDGEEGLFYVWTERELESVLSDEDAAFAKRFFQTEPEGNFEDEASGRRTGANVLHPLSDGLGLSEEVERLQRVRSALLTARGSRNRPLRDEKILTDWNGMMVGSLAFAGRALDRPDWVAAAEKAARFVLRDLSAADGSLLHRYFREDAGIRGMLDDYAYLAEGLIDLYQATFNPAWLAEAVRLADRQLADFQRPDGAYYLTEEGAEAPLGRQTAWYDGAMPSGNSASLENLMRLGHLTGDTRFLEAADRLLAASEPLWGTAPDAVSGMLRGLLWTVGPATEIVVVGPGSEPSTAQMLQAIRQQYAPHTVTLHRPVPDAAPIDAVAPYAAEMGEVGGRPAVYVCQGHVCDAPLGDAESLRHRLSATEA